MIFYILIYLSIFANMYFDFKFAAFKNIPLKIFQTRKWKKMILIEKDFMQTEGHYLGWIFDGKPLSHILSKEISFGVWWGTHEYIAYEFVLASPAVPRMSDSFNLDVFRDGC